MPPDAMRNRPEPVRMDSMDTPKSKAEIQARLAHIKVVLDNLEPKDKKYQELMFERAALVEDLEFAKDEVKAAPQQPDNVRPIGGALPPNERKEREARRDLNVILTREMGKLLSYPNASASGLQNLAHRLSDPKTVERFLGGEIGKQYFTRDVKRDQKAMDMANSALDAILEEAA
ncbi:MAG: hypothetical protein AAB431_03405 [Patescibacteria group bacterium]